MSLASKPVLHGRDHRPGGADPSDPGPWHNVGDSGEPAFQNSWENVGTGLAPMRFRLIIGSPLAAGDSGTPQGNSIEIQGSVIGGLTATVIFTLPVGYRPSHELRLAASDDVGDFVVLRVLASGDVIFGI